jgi:putative addiction module component (TIGR02574 family)
MEIDSPPDIAFTTLRLSPPLPSPIAFACIVSYPRCMELLTHDELVRLTPPERLALISQLWDSLEDDHLPLTAAQRAELDRRLASLDQDRREGITWATLKAELEQRCP